MLGHSAQPLASRYDVIGLDLDGVVYIGPDAVPYAVESLGAAASLGARLAYVTNNASRTPEDVAAHLRTFGLSVDVDDVVTSSQAASALLAERLETGSRVYVIGGDGLVDALRSAGLEPVIDPVDDVGAVAQGYGPEMPWKRVVHGARLVKAGRLWVATNTDLTMALAGGIGPGNGALVELVSQFAERAPIVAGKPYRPLFDVVTERFSASEALFVGDRLDTDIRGANDAGWSSLLVCTGLTTFPELVTAELQDRPTYIAADLRGLLEPHQSPVCTDGMWVLGGWRVHVNDQNHLSIEGRGEINDWWRCAASAAWEFLDRHTSYPQGGIANVDEIRPPR